jgi:hypothetical protein
VNAVSELTALFDEHDKNWSWFEEHYNELVKKFDGEFVAIHDQRVVDHDKELSVLMKRIKSKHPADRVFVDFVSSEKLTLIL